MPIDNKRNKILEKVILLCEVEHVEVSYNLIDKITTIIITVPRRMQMQCKSNQLDLRALIRLLQSTDHSYYGYTYTPCTAWALAGAVMMDVLLWARRKTFEYYYFIEFDSVAAINDYREIQYKKKGLKSGHSYD